MRLRTPLANQIKHPNPHQDNPNHSTVNINKSTKRTTSMRTKIINYIRAGYPALYLLS